MSQGPTRPSESQNQSPYTEFPKSLLIRRDLVKMPKALRAEINDVVVKYTERKLRKDGTLDVAVMAHEMTQSLVDMIVDQDEHHHAPLLALMILSLGDEYLQRTGIGERREVQSTEFNSSKADADDATLIERIEFTVACVKRGRSSSESLKSQLLVLKISH